MGIGPYKKYHNENNAVLVGCDFLKGEDEMQDVEIITMQNQERVRFAKEVDRINRREYLLEVKRQKELRRKQMERRFHRAMETAAWAFVAAGTTMAGIAVYQEAWEMMTAAGVWFALAAIAAMFTGKGAD